MSGVRHAPHIEKPMKRPATSTESHSAIEISQELAAQMAATKTGDKAQSSAVAVPVSVTSRSVRNSSGAR